MIAVSAGQCRHWPTNSSFLLARRFLFGVHPCEPDQMIGAWYTGTRLVVISAAMEGRMCVAHVYLFIFITFGPNHLSCRRWAWLLTLEWWVRGVSTYMRSMRTSCRKVASITVAIVLSGNENIAAGLCLFRLLVVILAGCNNVTKWEWQGWCSVYQIGIRIIAIWWTHMSKAAKNP